MNKNQQGFFTGRYIAANGVRCQIRMEDAELKWALVEQQQQQPQLDSSIGLQLDRENAYIKVNLLYLQLDLAQFDFPSSINTRIYNLIVNKKTKISEMEEVPKPRGDPLSCI